MDELRIPVVVDENRRLIIELPADVPTGPGEIVFRSLENGSAIYNQLGQHNAERERIKAKLASILTTFKAPDGAIELTAEERWRLAGKPGPRTSDEMIAEDRGIY